MCFRPMLNSFQYLFGNRNIFVYFVGVFWIFFLHTYLLWVLLEYFSSIFGVLFGVPLEFFSSTFGVLLEYFWSIFKYMFFMTLFHFSTFLVFCHEDHHKGSMFMAFPFLLGVLFGHRARVFSEYFWPIIASTPKKPIKGVAGHHKGSLWHSRGSSEWGRKCSESCLE